MTANRKPILIVLIALVAGAAGIFAAMSFAGGEKVETKYYMPPIELEEGFVVNLADAGSMPHYAKLKVAVQLAPMTAADRDYFKAGGDGGGHGGGASETGMDLVSTDATLKDAVITATSTFTTDQLKGVKGQIKLKEAILGEMRVAMKSYAPIEPKVVEKKEAGGIVGFFSGIFGGDDKAKEPKEDEHHSPLEPPYEIDSVYLTEFAIQ